MRLGRRRIESMPSTFDTVVIMCGATGVVMVVGSILLLYQGVIKLSERAADGALEAQFKDQIRINIRNPALGLFAIGFFFFALALYFANGQEERAKAGLGGPVVLSGHIRVGGVQSIADGIEVKLVSDESPMKVSTQGEISMTVQPLEKLVVEIRAPGYRPSKWVHPIRSDEQKNGRVQIPDAEFTPATGLFPAKPRVDGSP